MNDNIKIIVGSHGSGKSNWIYNYFFSNGIKEGKIDLDKKFYLVVPEQDTNDKQRTLMQIAGEKNLGYGILNIDVVSFDRIAHNVFDILNIEPEEESVIDDDIKTMMLSLTLSRLIKDDKIKYYKKMQNKVGFARKLTQVVSEFYSYNIKEEDIDKVIEKSSDEWFKNKLSDLKIIYKTFIEDLKIRNFSIKEDKYNLLNENLKNVDIFDDAVVAFDGFTGFTPVQMDIFKQIAKKAKEVYVTIDLRCNKSDLNSITKDLRSDSPSVFYLSKKFINDISKAASDIKKELLIENFIYTDSDIKYKNSPDLLYIEKHIFEYEKDQQKIDSKNIEVFACKNVAEEVTNTINKVKNLLNENKNYKYSDIKIIVPSIEDYKDSLIKSFNKANIPLFIDDTTGLLNSPYIETIRSAIDIVLYDFSYDSVMRYINAGIIEKTSEINMLDNIILKYGIRGFKRYKNGFEKLALDDKYRDSILKTKDELFDKIFVLYEKIKKPTTIKNYISAIKDFIIDTNLDDKFNQFIDNFNQKEKDDIDYNRQFTILNESFDITKKTLNNISLINSESDDIVDLLDFKRLLDIGFTEKGVKSIPYLLDQVVVGDLMRSRFDNPKVEIFLGLNQSKVPASSSDLSLIDDTMRKEFSTLNIMLSQTTTETTLNQRFYIYLALTNPTDKLILSYPRINASNDADEKSPVLISIEKMFTNLSEHKVEFIDDEIETNFKLENENLDKDLAKRLINKDGKEYVGSVSAIEEFNLCPYKYFLDKSMSLSEREVYNIEPIDMGNYFHKIMELIYKNGFDKSYDEKKISECIDNAIKLIENDTEYKIDKYHSLDKFRDLNKNDKDFYGSNKVEFIKSRAKKVLISAIKALNTIQGNSKLSFKESEKHFSHKIDDNEFRGIIDRIETYEDNDKMYVNVIDYKSGKKEISIDDINDGIKLQLMVYLDYLMSDEYKGKKDAISCGSFYFRMADPVIKIDSMSEIDNIDEKKMKELSYVGILNSNEECVSKIKDDLKPHIAAKGKSANEITAYEDENGFGIYGVMLDDKEISETMDTVHSKISDSIKNINDGVIKIRPHTKETCEYCPYSTICRIDQMTKSADVEKVDAIDGD